MRVPGQIKAIIDIQECILDKFENMAPGMNLLSTHP